MERSRSFRQRLTGRGEEPSTPSPGCTPDLSAASGPEGSPEVDVTLSELLHLPSVAAAVAASPREWRQVAHFDDPFDATTLQELSEFVWLLNDEDGWSLALGDEVKPYVDLEVEESDDPAIAVLAADPGVSAAHHEDRELYRVETPWPMELEAFACLAAQALTGHHLQAVGRTGR